MNLEIDNENYSAMQIEGRIRELVEENELCSLATVQENNNRDPSAHIATAWYAYDDELRLYVLTPPDTDHAKNLEENDSIALTIFDSHQDWSAKKKGLQVFGTAEKIPDEDAEEALELYNQRFPGLEEHASTTEELQDLDSSFYVITPERIKLFDEPAFGNETWITAELYYRD